MPLASQTVRLDQIKADILANNICQNLAKTATQLVFGDGNPNADIVFVGEAPGKKEDISGLPFVGAAGKFLDEMLNSIHLKRSDVYITNIVKYRPPNNRDPLPLEKEAFLPYLQSQLAVIAPKIVVTLGRHSTNCFLPELQIGKVHGQPQKLRKNLRPRVGDSVRHSKVSALAVGQATASWIILPLYHPAAALYSGGLRQTLLEDFSKIPTILKELEK